MTRHRVAAGALLVALLPLPASAAGEEPVPCRIQALAPARALVGEQIVLRFRTLRRPEVSAATWISGPSFAGYRAERLPGLSGETRVSERNASYLVFEERFALFPVRAGRLGIPPARLQCVLHTLPGETPRAFDATSAALFVEVSAPPAAGRPTDWTGLVGPVQVSIRAEPHTLELGASLHVEVSMEGEADLRDAALPFGGARELDGAEIFPSRPRLLADPGERLRWRRSFALEIVPRRVGVFTLPALRVPYFDPVIRRYAVASTQPVEIRVNPPGGS